MVGVQPDDDAIAGLSEAKQHAYLDEKYPHSDVSHELDGIHDGLEFPTDEERATLRRVADKIPYHAYCEHLSGY